MKSTSGFPIIKILIVITVIVVILGMVHGMVVFMSIPTGVSERWDNHKDTHAPVEPSRFTETKVIEGGLGRNHVYLITDTKTGQQWLRSHDSGFAQVSPSATPPAILRCEAEVPR